MNKIKRQIDIIHNDHVKKDIVIIHLSDIHFNIDTKLSKLNLLKEEIYKNNPDYVVITGDLLDEPSITKNQLKIKMLLVFLTDIASFAKVLISLGNHDIYINSDYLFFNKLNDLKNIYILNDCFYQDEYIYISGITLPGYYYYNMSHHESLEALLEHINSNKELITKLPKNIPKVSLIHSPKLLTESNTLKLLKEYDLILSGHTHAGLVPDICDKIFKSNCGLISPNKRLFPNIARGKIEKYFGNKLITIIISGGVTKLSRRSSKILSKLNFIYNISVNKIIITKKRGKYYEKN